MGNRWCYYHWYWNKRFLFKEGAWFLANTKPLSVNDIKGYNRATGKLFIFYELILIVLGLPLLKGQNRT